MGTSHKNRENHKYGGGFYSGQTQRNPSQIDDKYSEQAFKEAHKIMESIMTGKGSIRKA
ncbi:MAG: hypothetical protein NT130_03480 [Candidatus Micrarchaeota archaeon]|nr:hypothetical protein [Candidatus Micrarchaeota archaeon]